MLYSMATRLAMRPGVCTGLQVGRGVRLRRWPGPLFAWLGCSSSREAGRQKLFGSPGPERATELPQFSGLKVRLPSKSLHPRLSQFQLKKHTLSGTVTGGGCTRMHVTRSLCADEGEAG